MAAAGSEDEEESGEESGEEDGQEAGAAFNAAALTVPADNKQSNGHHLTHVRVYADWGDDGLFMRQVQQYAPRSHGSMPWRIDYEDGDQVGALLRAAACWLLHRY